MLYCLTYGTTAKGIPQPKYTDFPVHHTYLKPWYHCRVIVTCTGMIVVLGFQEISRLVHIVVCLSLWQWGATLYAAEGSKQRRGGQGVGAIAQRALAAWPAASRNGVALSDGRCGLDIKGLRLCPPNLLVVTQVNLLYIWVHVTTPKEEPYISTGSF